MEGWKADNAFHSSEPRLRQSDWLSTCTTKNNFTGERAWTTYFSISRVFRLFFEY
jgi:hypothetical protein